MGSIYMGPGPRAEHIVSAAAMKTLCLTLSLLLLTLHSCDAAEATNNILATCCYSVATYRIPRRLITRITKTGSTCSTKAFIVETIKGKQTCYSQDSHWVLDLYRRLLNTER